MSRPTKPIKVVLTASIYLVASSALQGTMSRAEAKSDASQRSVDNESMARVTPEGQFRQILLALSPEEKLKIAGDRIRLSRSNANNNINRGGRVYSNPIKPPKPKPPIPPNTAKPQQKKKTQE